MRDIALNSTAYFNFCAFRVDTGAPADVASIAVQAYPDDSATQITSGITVTQPDSLTGSYNIAVAATVANGYAAGKTYALKITTGTVNSVSVVGAVVGEFTIRVGVPGLVTTGIAQASAAGTLVLASSASFADDQLNGMLAVIVAGTGAGQARQIYDYVNSTDTASVSPNWATTPDTTSVYEIYASPPSPTAAAALPSVTVGADGISATSLADGAITAAKIAAAALVSAKFDATDPPPSNVVEVNNIAIDGAGTALDPFGPA